VEEIGLHSSAVSLNRLRIIEPVGGLVGIRTRQDAEGRKRGTALGPFAENRERGRRPRTVGRRSQQKLHGLRFHGPQTFVCIHADSRRASPQR